MASPNNLSLAAVVLAAGVAKRFGSDKRLADISSHQLSSQQLTPQQSTSQQSISQQQPHHLLAATIASIEPHCAQVFVALRPEDSKVLPALLGCWLDHPKIHLCYVARAAQGMGASLSGALDCVKNFSQKSTSSFDAVMIMLGDMPFVQRTTFQILIKKMARNKMTFPCYLSDSSQENWGHPVIFGAEYLSLLENLSGDQGGRKILAAHPEACQPIVVEDPGVYRDIDTPSDLS